MIKEKLLEAQNYKNEMIKKRQKLDEEGRKYFNDFIDKIVLYSGGIIATTLPIFISASNKIEIDNTMLFLSWLFFLISLIFGIYSKFSYSYLLFSKGAEFYIDAEMYLWKIKDENIEELYTDKLELLTEEQKQKIIKNKGKVEKAKNKVYCKSFILGIISNTMLLFSICSFIVGIIFMGIVFFQLSIKL